MVLKDEKKTTFTIDQGLYYYKVIPFGLKNVEATYQCLINKIFQWQISCNIEMYVDDMLVKSVKSDQHFNDLREAFTKLWRHQMWHNPVKYAFGVTLSKFLRFMVTR